MDFKRSAEAAKAAQNMDDESRAPIINAVDTAFENWMEHPTKKDITIPLGSHAVLESFKTHKDEVVGSLDSDGWKATFVEAVDYGHDTMPGEKSYEPARLRLTRKKSD